VALWRSWTIEAPHRSGAALGHRTSGTRNSLTPQSVQALRIVVPFFDVPWRAQTEPTNGRSRHNADIVDTYAECVAVLAWSLAAAGMPLRMTLATNTDNLPRRLNALGVTDFDVEHPEPVITRGEARSEFPGNMYLLDCLVAECAASAPDQPVVFLDPDCLVLDARSLIEIASRPTLSVHYEEYPLTETINGQSRLSLSLLTDATSREPVRWVGGEFLAGTVAALSSLATDVERVWSDRFLPALDRLGCSATEEHVLSVALHGSPEVRDVGPAVKRCWTRAPYRNIDGGELRTTVLHLPGEKGFGFHTLARTFRDDGAPADVADLTRKLLEAVPLRPNRLRDAYALGFGTLRSAVMYARDPNVGRSRRRGTAGEAEGAEPT
jgi:hypothetical protein